MIFILFSIMARAGYTCDLNILEENYKIKPTLNGQHNFDTQKLF